MLRILLTIVAAVAIAFVSAELNEEILGNNAQLYIYENQINETLKNLSEKLAQNDPAFIRKIQFNIDNDIARASFDAEDIRITGYSKFWATNLKISVLPPSMTFDIQFEEIHILVPYYKIDALAVFIPFYGSGFMNLRATTMNIGGSAKIKLGTGGLSGVKNLKARFSLKESNLTISGIINNEPMSQIISTATTECFPEFVNTYGDRLGELVGGILENIINEALNPSTPEEQNVLSSGLDILKYEGASIKYSYEV